MTELRTGKERVRYVTWILFAFALVYVLAQVFPARSQEMNAYQRWIHDNKSACCDHRDCVPVTVSYTVNGWQVDGTMWPVPQKDVIPWPFGVPYACISGRRVRCLFLREGM